MTKRQSPMKIERVPGKNPGRCVASGYGNLIWAAAVAVDRVPDVAIQARDMFNVLETHLHQLGSQRQDIISATVYLADMKYKFAFDQEWAKWVGDDLSSWPQRACVGTQLSGDCLVEISVVAVRSLDD